MADRFTLPTYSWSHETQAVFLSDPAASPPRLTYGQIQTILNRDAVDPMGLLEEAKVHGLALPGPDGDFVELVVFTAALWRALQEHLAGHCRANGIGWRAVPEPQLKATRW